MQTALWTMAGMSAVIAAVAALADRRRTRRADLDRVGWMPWPGVLIAAIIAAALFAALALRS